MPTIGFNSFVPATGVSVYRPEDFGAIRTGYTEGTATGGDTGTIQKTGAGWTTNAYQTNAGADIYWRVVIWSGTNAGESRLIVSNTSTTLTVDTPFTESIDTTSKYFIGFDSAPAINACLAQISVGTAGSTLLFSNGLSYYIGETVEWPSNGGWIVGEYGGGAVNKQVPAEMRWIGNAGETMVHNTQSGSFVQYHRMMNMVLRGQVKNVAAGVNYQHIDTAAGIGIDWGTKLDHGSGLDDCWIKQVNSYPWYCRNGGINVAMRRTRWDNNPYPARWDVIGGDSLWIDAMTGDDTHGPLEESSARGLLYIDAEANNPAGGGGMFLSIRGATLEVHHPLDPDYGIVTYHPKETFDGSSGSDLRFPQLIFDYDNCYGKIRLGEPTLTRWPFLKVNPPTDNVIIRHGTGYKFNVEGIPSYQTQAGTNAGPQTGLTAPFHPLMPSHGASAQMKTVALFNAMIEHNGPLQRYTHRASAYEWVTFSGGSPTYDAGTSRQVYSGEMFADVAELANGATGTTAIAICGTQSGGIAGGMLSDPALLTGITATIVDDGGGDSLYVSVTDASPFKLGDMILINGVTKTRIAEVNYTDNLLYVNSAVPAGAGVSIAWLTPVWRTGTIATT